VKVRPFSGDIAHLLTLQSVAVRQAGKEQIMRIEASSPAAPAVLMKFAGIDSVEAAKALTGAELLVNREQASPLEEGEFYVEDLRGLAVFDSETGKILGHITDIIEGGGGNLAELMLCPQGESGEKSPAGELRLVPFRKEFFGEISLEKGAALRKRWILE
jgi:16S rRNA processing protein RimM